jgi:hypothetical protein
MRERILLKHFRKLSTLVWLGWALFHTAAFSDSGPAPRLIFVEPILSGKNQNEFTNFFKTRFAKDGFKKKVQMGYERIQSSKDTQGRTRFHFRTIDENHVPESLRQILTQHPALREFYTLRAAAHAMAGIAQDTPIYISFSENGMFNLGPVFVDSTRFLIVDRLDPQKSVETTNLVTFEKAKLFHLEIFSVDQLVTSGYLPFIAAHEFAHALMQDLYGIAGIENVLKRHKSTAGHDVMLTSDPYVAFVEGFAEAFEAYLYEKIYPHLIPQDLGLRFDEPFLLYLFNQFGRGRNGWDRAAESLLLFWGDNLGNYLMNHLRATRIVPVIKNQYISESPVGIEVFEKSLAFGDGMDDILEQHSEIPAPARAVSREGVVAHIFYRLLKEGRWPAIVQTFAKTKPIHVADFYLKYRKIFPQDEILSRLMFENFSPAGRGQQELIYNNYRKYWEFQRTSLNRVKEDLVILWTRPLNATEFRKNALELFPEIGTYDLAYQYNFNDKYLDSLIKAREETIRHFETAWPLEAKNPIEDKIFSNPRRHSPEITQAYLANEFKSLESLRKYEEKINRKFRERQSKAEKKMSAAYEAERLQDFEALDAGLSKLPRHIWLTSGKTGFVSKAILEKGIERIDLNIATRFELMWFLNSLYGEMLYHEAGYYKKDLPWIFRFNEAFHIEKNYKVSALTGSRVGDSYDMADRILAARAAKPGGSFQSIYDLKDELPEAWFETVFEAYGNLYQ